MNPQIDLKEAKQYVKDRINTRNVIGIGIGKKITGGQETGTDCVRVYVMTKLKQELVRPAELVPAGPSGVLTDVIEIGRLGRRGLTLTPALDPKADPTPKPGSQIRVKTDAPNVNSGATGTLGMVVSYGGQRYILGCNHTLSANGRVLTDPDAKVVSAVFVGDEPPIADPGLPYVPIHNGDNIADCALARINGYKTVTAVFPASFGDPKPSPKDPQRQMRVTKLGAATQITHGTIKDVSADPDVDYDFGTFHFVNQILVEGDDDNFAIAGDSGSIIVDEESQQPVGMVFAASGKYAFACPLSGESGVLKALESQLAGGKSGGPALNLVVHDA